MQRKENLTELQQRPWLDNGYLFNLLYKTLFNMNYNGIRDVISSYCKYIRRPFTIVNVSLVRYSFNSIVKLKKKKKKKNLTISTYPPLKCFLFTFNLSSIKHCKLFGLKIRFHMSSYISNLTLEQMSDDPQHGQNVYKQDALK